MSETGGLRLKIFIIGLEDAGKTSLIDRIVNFEYESISTTSHSITTSDYSTINYDKRKQIKCDLCTSNALRNFKSMLNETNNANDVCIALIGVYDITNKHSWTHLRKLAHDLKDELKHINFLILGNKFDLLEKRQVCKTEVENYAVKHGFLFSEVSIKNGFNVREAFDNLVDRSFIRFKHRKLASGLFGVSRDTLEKQVTCVNSTLPKLSNSLNVESSRSTASTTTNMIDVNSNSLLLSFSAYNRNGELETKKMNNDLNEQIKYLKNEIEKRDSLILELNSVKDIERVKVEDTARLDAIFSIERASAENAKRELVAVQVKCESLENELKEEREKVVQKDQEIGELKRSNETFKNQNIQFDSLNAELRQKLNELEVSLGSTEAIVCKSTHTISALESEIKLHQERTAELELIAKTHQTEKEELSKKLETVNENYSKLTSTVSAQLQTEMGENFELLETKLKELVGEKQSFHEKNQETDTKLKVIEESNAVNLQKIEHLVIDLNKYEKELVESRQTIENLKTELESACTAKKIVDKEFELIQEKYLSSHAELITVKNQIEMHTTKHSQSETNIKRFEKQFEEVKSKYDQFKTDIAILLSDNFVQVNALEEDIKEKLKLLMLSSKDRGIMIVSLEDRIKQIELELSEERNSIRKYREEFNSSRQSELQNSLISLNQNLTLLNESLAAEKLKFQVFTEKLQRLFKIATISDNPEKILESVEKTYKSECEKSEQSKKSAYAELQSKYNSIKEQLANKDLHVDLLRKKIADLEAEKHGRSEFRKDLDEQHLLGKSLSVKVDKLKSKLSFFIEENRNLKAQVYDINCLQEKYNVKEDEVSKLSVKVNELERQNEKYLARLGDARCEIDQLNCEIDKTRSSYDSSIDLLSKELRETRMKLEKTQRRENELLDFRHLVAKKLGLEISSLCTPDYDILARIESHLPIANTNHVHLISTDHSQHGHHHHHYYHQHLHQN